MATILLFILSASQAIGEVYFSDANVEISGTGARVSRSCTVVFKPSQIFGGVLAPRLVLVTSGQTVLSYGAEKNWQYSAMTIVYNNVRHPFLYSKDSTITSFINSNIGKALKSRKLFFVTAQLSDTGNYVSSRYEDINFDAVLAKIASNCPFDAEGLMSDIASRERTERELGVSPGDLTLIRWALSKKYVGALVAPEARFSLSETDRTYLKRYTVESGLPVSRYLTADSARVLSLEGQLLAKNAVTSPPLPAPSPMPAPPLPTEVLKTSPNSVTFAIVNKTASIVHVRFFDRENEFQVDPDPANAYVLEANNTRTYRVKCTPRRTICYGANMVGGNLSPFWGAGREGKSNCVKCCLDCPNTEPLEKTLYTWDSR